MSALRGTAHERMSDPDLDLDPVPSSNSDPDPFALLLNRRQSCMLRTCGS